MSGQSGGGGEPGGLVLYRCPVPTNFLCPCGTVARGLARQGLSYRTERVPLRKSSRAGIVELTGQERVPVVVDGDEVIHDSRRIRQYLDYRYGGQTEAGAG
jgi:glutathione S-transferase